MSDIYQRVADITSAGASCVLVTVAKTSGSGPMTLGKKMLVDSSGRSMGTVGGGALEFEAINTAKEVMKDEKSRLISYLLDEGKVMEQHTTIPMICGGTVQLFYEYLSGGEQVFIFGGGHVGKALAQQLDLIGFYTIIIEDRPDIFSELDCARKRVQQGFHDYAVQADIDEKSYVVLCTPSHENDYDVVRALVDRNIRPRYLGMLASPAKKADFTRRMTDEYGANVDLSFVFSPVGLDIGGSMPEEIALSVAAEMLAVKYKRAGLAHMRDR